MQTLGTIPKTHRTSPHSFLIWDASLIFPLPGKFIWCLWFGVTVIQLDSWLRSKKERLCICQVGVKLSNPQLISVAPVAQSLGNPLWKKHILYSIVWNLNLKGVAIVSPTSFNWNFKHPSSYVRFWGPTHGPFLCTWLVGPSRDVGNLELGKTTGQLESQKNCWNRKMAGKWSTKAENSLRHGLVKYHGQGQRFVQAPSIFNSWERNSNIWHKDAQGHGLWPSPRSLLNDFRMAMDELLASPEQVHFMADVFSSVCFLILLEV